MSTDNVDFEEWARQCSLYLRENRPDQPIYDVDFNVLTLAFNSDKKPANFLGADAIPRARGRKAIFYSYFLEDVNHILAALRPGVSMAEVDPAALSSAYRAGTTANSFVLQEVPLDTSDEPEPLAAQTPLPRKRRRIALLPVLGLVLVLACLAMVFVLKSSTTDVDQQSLTLSTVKTSRHSKRAGGSQVQSQGRLAATRPIMAVSSSNTRGLPIQISASCSPYVADERGYVDLFWSAPNATEGEASVNGVRRELQMPSGSARLETGFGNVSVRLDFKNVAFESTWDKDITVRSNSSTRSNQNGQYSDLSPRSNQSIPEIIGFSVNLDETGGEVSWNVANADRIEISVGGQTAASSSSPFGTTWLGELMRGETVVLKAYSGDTEVEKTATASGVYSFGWLGK